MLRNKRGSALLWATIVSAFMVILLLALLTLSFSYYHRSLRSSWSTQAYYTAMSVTTALAEELCDGGDEFLPHTVGESIAVNSIALGEDMGTCTANVMRSSDDEVVITATAEYAGCERSVSVRLVQTYAGSTASANENAVISQTSAQALLVDTIYGNVYLGGGTHYITTKIYGDVYCTGEVQLGAGGMISGNVYAASFSIVNAAAVPATLPKSITVGSIDAETQSWLPQGYALYIDSNYADNIDSSVFISPYKNYNPPHPTDLSLNYGTNNVTVDTANLDYELTGATYATANITVNGSGTVNITVPANYTLRIGTITRTDESSTVNILINNNGAVQFATAGTIKVNVYQKVNNTEVGFAANVTVQGTILTDTIWLAGNTVVIDPAGTAQAGGGSSTVQSTGWTIERYYES